MRLSSNYNSWNDEQYLAVQHGTWIVINEGHDIERLNCIQAFAWSILCCMPCLRSFFFGSNRVFYVQAESHIRFNHLSSRVAPATVIITAAVPSVIHTTVSAPTRVILSQPVRLSQNAPSLGTDLAHNIAGTGHERNVYPASRPNPVMVLRPAPVRPFQLPSAPTNLAGSGHEGSYSRTTTSSTRNVQGNRNQPERRASAVPRRSQQPTHSPAGTRLRP